MPFLPLSVPWGDRLTTEILAKLTRQQVYRLNGIPRLPKGLVASTLAQAEQRNLL